MRSLSSWLEEYGQSHRHPVNKMIHYVAVPTIYFTVLGLLWALPRLTILPPPWDNWALLAMVPVMTFYFLLSAALGMVMTLITALMLGLWHYIEGQGMAVLPLALGLFVVMWVFQFIGHHVEGKKPSFFKDLVFLLIGPAWVARDLVLRLKLPLSFD